jgi:XisI protein
MDKIKQYEAAILSILNEYAKFKYANVDGKNYLIADKENRRYQLVTIGWERQKFIHSCVMHFDIIEGKIWVWQNNTEWEVGDMLHAKGIPKSDIVPGFFTPSMRAYTEYALG